MLFLEKGLVCTCVFMHVCVCVASGPAIQPCQAPRAKPSLLDRNCLFTGYTGVYLKSIRLAGLLLGTPYRHRHRDCCSERHSARPFQILQLLFYVVLLRLGRDLLKFYFGELNSRGMGLRLAVD